MATTMAYPETEPGTDRYYAIKDELWGHFYSLEFGKRVSIILSELKYIMLFLAGWIAFTAFLRYGHFTMAALSSLSALAQDASPHAGPAAAMTEQQSKYLLWLAINLALVLVMLGCAGHMLFAKRKNQWVAKTGTFLLGFLTKSVGTLLP